MSRHSRAQKIVDRLPAKGHGMGAGSAAEVEYNRYVLPAKPVEPRVSESKVPLFLADWPGWRTE